MRPSITIMKIVSLQYCKEFKFYTPRMMRRMKQEPIFNKFCLMVVANAPPPLFHVEEFDITNVPSVEVSHTCMCLTCMARVSGVYINPSIAKVRTP